MILALGAVMGYKWLWGTAHQNRKEPLLLSRLKEFALVEDGTYNKVIQLYYPNSQTVQFELNLAKESLRHVDIASLCSGTFEMDGKHSTDDVLIYKGTIKDSSLRWELKMEKTKEDKLTATVVFDKETYENRVIYLPSNPDAMDSGEDHE